MLGISLTSPDLVISAESPDIPPKRYGDSPELLEIKCHQKVEESIELSLENGIDEYDIKNNLNTPSVKFSTFYETFQAEISPEVSFELPPPPTTEDKSTCELDTVEHSVQLSQTSECHSPKVNLFQTLQGLSWLSRKIEMVDVCNGFIAGYW